MRAFCFFVTQNVLRFAMLGFVLLLSPQARAETVTLITVGSGNSSDWPTIIAQAKGFFKEGGLDVQFIGAQSPAAALLQVTAGSGDLTSTGLADPLYAIDKGAKIGILGIVMQVPPLSLWAKPAIKSFAGLRNKTLMVGGPKDITRIYLERVLGPNGLKDGDYDLVYAGTSAARYAALASGGIDGTFLLPPFSFKAETDGFTLICNLSDYVKDLPFTGFGVNLTWAAAHKPALDAFLKAYRRGVAWFYDEKNRAEAIQIYRAQSGMAQADAEKTYDYFKSIKAFAGDEMSPQALAPLVKVLADMGEISNRDPKYYLGSEVVGPGK